MNKKQKNVLGSNLQLCGKDPVTGFYRNGCCNTGPGDVGTHTICAVMTDEFLEYSKGNRRGISTSHDHLQLSNQGNLQPE